MLQLHKIQYAMVFDLFGTDDPLDYGLLFAYVAQYNSLDKVKIIFDLITNNSAKIMRLKNYGIKVGIPADFNVLFSEKECECLRLKPGRIVFKNGKIIAKVKKKKKSIF